MGPPSEDGGNVCTEPTTTLSLPALQWGRRPRTAEIGGDPVVTQGLFPASMGPPSEDGGNQGNTIDYLCFLCASMGPPSEDGGNAGTSGDVSGRMGASMGPPSEDGGNSIVGSTLASSMSLQWGRRPRTAEIIRPGIGAESRPQRFNGAAVRGRRKSSSCDNGPTADIWASMGPPSEDGGNERRCDSAARHLPGFNGAAVRGRRKSLSLLTPGCCLWMLQWGRRPRTAEICVRMSPT